MDYKKLAERLNEEYERVCDQYIDAFCEKHEVEFEGWVGKKVGGTAFVKGYAIDFTDIRYDIDKVRPAEDIWNWLVYSHDAALAGDKAIVNYEHYCLGCPLALQRKNNEK